MPGLDLLTQIDTNRFGLLRPNPEQQERILPIEDRSWYREALNRSLKKTENLRDVTPPNSVGSTGKNRRPEVSPARRDENRTEPVVNAQSESKPSDENSHPDETKYRPGIPQSVLNRLETNVAQIVPSIADFPEAPPGLADSLNPLIQVLFEVETEPFVENLDLELQTEIEEIAFAPQGFLEAIGQFDGAEISQEISNVIVEELEGPGSLIQNEILTDLTTQELEVSEVVPISLEETFVPQANIATEDSVESVSNEISVESMRNELVDSPTVSESDQILPLVINENSSRDGNELTTSHVVEEPPGSVESNDSVPEAKLTTDLKSSSEKQAFDQPEGSQTGAEESQTESHRTAVPVSNYSQSTSANQIDTTTVKSEEQTNGQHAFEHTPFANQPSQSFHRSETGQIASQVSEDGPLPSPISNLETGTSDSNASIRSANVKETTPTAMRVAKELNPAQLVDRVAQAVRVSHQAGRTIKFRLEPPELGTLQVEIRQENGMTTARLEVQTAAAQKAISENMSQLREAIQQSGNVIDQIDVQLMETKNEEHPSNQSRERNEGQRQNKEDRGQSQDRQSSDSESSQDGENDSTSQGDSGPEKVDIQV